MQQYPFALNRALLYNDTPQLFPHGLSCTYLSSCVVAGACPQSWGARTRSGDIWTRHRSGPAAQPRCPDLEPLVRGPSLG